jgi:hypothetical protein
MGYAWMMQNDTYLHVIMHGMHAWQSRTIHSHFIPVRAVFRIRTRKQVVHLHIIITLLLFNRAAFYAVLIPSGTGGRIKPVDTCDCAGCKKSTVCR